MGKASALDRLIGFFSPGVALNRHVARQALERAYEGASKADGWNPRRANASANADHLSDARELRARARSLYQNVPYITRALESRVDYIVGTGIIPRSLAPNAKKVKELWDKFSSQASAENQLNIDGLVALAELTAQRDGEVLLRIRQRRASDGLHVPVQFQVLEIDWLDSLKNGDVDGNTVVSGVEYDKLGRVVAYWLYDQHPGEVTSFRIRSSLKSSRVLAKNIIHYFNHDRPGQARGITQLAPVITRVRDLMLYEDAELERKNLETRLSVLASGDASMLNMSESPSLAEKRSSGVLGHLDSGSIIGVPTGSNLTVVEPKALPGYESYVKQQLRLIAAGVGTTYELMTGDMSEVNFSSARVALLQFKRNVERRQWSHLIPILMQRIWDSFIDAAILSGALPVNQARDVDWTTPRWEYVNPQQEVGADLAEVAGGLISLSEKQRQRGYDPELLYAEMKSDMERLKKDGTLELMLALLGKSMNEAKSSQENTKEEP